MCLLGLRQLRRYNAELHHAGVDDGRRPARQQRYRRPPVARRLSMVGHVQRFGAVRCVRFTVFDSSNTPELQSPNVTALFEDAEGTIWIGHETGELTCYRVENSMLFPSRQRGIAGKFMIRRRTSGGVGVERRWRTGTSERRVRHPVAFRQNPGPACHGQEAQGRLLDPTGQRGME